MEPCVQAHLLPRMKESDVMGRLWLSPEEAAPVLGMKPAKIRNYMRRGILDLGLAIPPEKTGKTMWEFRIYPAKIEKIIGEKLERPEEGEKQE